MRVISGPTATYPSSNQDGSGGSESWTAVVMAVLPFLLPTLVLLEPLFSRIAITAGLNQNQIRIAGSLLAIAVALGVLGALLAGWLRGFPRWAYPYLGLVVAASLLLANASTPGLSIFGYDRGRELWGWLAWVPLLVVALTAVIVLLISQPIKQLLRLITNIWYDWTLLSFAIYGMFIFGPSVMLDEVHSVWERPVTAGGALLLALGAGMTMRARSMNRRVAALMIGFTAAFVVLSGFSTVYWQTHNAGGWPRTTPPGWSGAVFEQLQAWLFLVLILLLPSLIGLLRRSTQRLQIA